MPDLRTDWLTGRSVIIAENRSARPNEFAAQRPPTPIGGAADAQRAGCPFCPGHESQTPPAVDEQLDAQGRWRVRVVPNKYPAVTTHDTAHLVTSNEGIPATDSGEGNTSPAVGIHEVIIESPQHVLRTADLSIGQLGAVLQMYARRLDHWRNSGQFPYALLFKNQGPRAGASLAHLHSQLITLSEVPPLVDAELRRAEQYYRQNRTCPYCRLVADERTIGERLVLDTDDYVAFCPYASVQPYEVWLLPAAHEPSFERPLCPDAIVRLSAALHSLLQRVEAALPEASYNLMLRTTPWQTGCDAHGHWRIEVLPRLVTFAGLEMTTGIYINQIAPERAVRHLRTS